MSWQGPEFVLVLVAISTLGWMVTTWIRARHGYPVENEWKGVSSKGDADADRKIELLTGENHRLHGQVGRLEERLAVLERIATDPATRLTHEIDALRSDSHQEKSL